MVPIHSSLVEIYVAVMELSKEWMPEMRYCKKYLTQKGIGVSSKILHKLNYIPANHITAFSYTPHAGCSVSILASNAYERETLRLSCCKQQMSGFLFNTTQCESVLWKTGWCEVLTVKCQFSNMEGNVKKKKDISFQMIDLLFYFSFLSLYQKVSMNFSVTDVHPTSECWLLITFLQVFNILFKIHLFSETIKVW